MPDKSEIERIIEEAGWSAYLACLEADRVKRRTRTLGLPRGTYATEFAAAARAKVIAYLEKSLPAPPSLQDQS